MSYKPLQGFNKALPCLLTASAHLLGVQKAALELHAGPVCGVAVLQPAAPRSDEPLHAPAGLPACQQRHLRPGFAVVPGLLAVPSRLDVEEALSQRWLRSGGIGRERW